MTQFVDWFYLQSGIHGPPFKNSPWSADYYFISGWSGPVRFYKISLVRGSLFTVLLRSLGQLSVYKSMKLEIEELKRRENFLDKKWDI